MKRKLLANTPDEHSDKIFNKILANQLQISLKGVYAILNGMFFPGISDNLAYTYQAM